MKLIKKTVSAILACALSLTMLTACGGSGGGDTPVDVTLETSKIGSVFKANKYYLDCTESGSYSNYSWSNRTIYARVGAKNYVEQDSKKGWGDAEYIYTPATQYYYGSEHDDIMIKDDQHLFYPEIQPFTIVVGYYSSGHEWTFCNILPTSYDSITSFRAATKTVKGSSYYGETIGFAETDSHGDERNVELTFCYTGDVCKYIVRSVSTDNMKYETIYTVNKFTTSFDESIVEIPSQYTQILSIYEYMEMYPDD